MIRVLLVDDQPLIRVGLRGILELEDDIEVVGEASSGRQALTRLAATPADVVLMDIRMPEMDGIETTSAICADPRYADVRVLVLTTFETDEYVVAALQAGASGFLGKGAEPEAVADAVRVIARGESLLSPAATRSLIERFLAKPAASTAPVVPALDALTERERETLVLVAQGKSNEEIAEHFVISPHTVKTHISRTMMKLDAHDRAQLVVIAYSAGLLHPQ
ncbi:DNA-binding NarL/FixJ family response regulator [Kribbella antiqua]|uniref:DNA-binding NarL/FixJ family response regulator n=1 Tax=Kribbella antiqua TaxID=2512217 RepID=A0A4R2IPC9_9ACTN|nr:response regulator transcription factor [Kribbella antiqua]TCO47004.1 DNA-binding NarL/FixJ family response regulator [Kribbella antiqua]